MIGYSGGDRLSDSNSSRVDVCIHALPFCQEQVSVPKPIHGYPQSPEHIGEHLKKRRLDLGLLQREVAEQLGVSMFTIINWESGETRPLVRYGPRIIDFLGYDPLPEPKSFSQEVWKLRWRRGLTQQELAARLHTDESTIRDWERGQHEATVRLYRRVQDVAEMTPSIRDNR